MIFISGIKTLLFFFLQLINVITYKCTYIEIYTVKLLNNYTSVRKNNMLT